MAYRVNGLPPFQVSFSITFPEGYVGKEKMDTKFHVDADDSQVQAWHGVAVVPTARWLEVWLAVLSPICEVLQVEDW